MPARIIKQNREINEHFRAIIQKEVEEKRKNERKNK
jgi:hypothetical protein